MTLTYTILRFRLPDHGRLPDFQVQEQEINKLARAGWFVASSCQVNDFVVYVMGKELENPQTSQTEG